MHFKQQTSCLLCRHHWTKTELAIPGMKEIFLCHQKKKKIIIQQKINKYCFLHSLDKGWFQHDLPLFDGDIHSTETRSNKHSTSAWRKSTLLIPPPSTMFEVLFGPWTWESTINMPTTCACILGPKPEYFPWLGATASVQFKFKNQNVKTSEFEELKKLRFDNFVVVCCLFHRKNSYSRDKWKEGQS